jgi:type I restriction enzyme S subunit
MKLLVSEIFEFVRNGLNIKQNSNEGGLPITRIETIANGEINLKKVGYGGVSLNKAKRYLLEDGDILFSHINSVPHLGKCALYEKNLGQLVHGMNLLCFRANKKKLLPKFALYMLRSNVFRNQLTKSIKKAVNQASVSTTDIKKIRLNIPSLIEQKRITTLLDSANKLLRLRKKTILKLTELEESIYKQLIKDFDEVNTNISLSELIKKTNNINPVKAYSKDEFTYIDIASVDNKSKSISTPKVVYGKNAPSRARQVLQINDILVSTVRPNLNAIAKIDTSYHKPIASTGFCILRCDESKLLPEVLFSIVKSKNFIDEMVKMTNGASYPAVTDKIVKSYKISLVPMSLQNKFAKIIRNNEIYKTKLVAHNGKLNSLFNSLQHQLFEKV